ncbi:MAG: DEAD/DEAH box helicase [Pseudomonadota bacterium]
MRMVSERLSEALSHNLLEDGFTDFTDVQTAVLKADRGVGDFLLLAPTSSGKTLAYGLAIAQDLIARSDEPVKGPRAVVVVPTREIAVQIAGVFQRLFRETGHQVQFGFADAEFHGDADILVTTPCGLRRQIAAGSIVLSNCACVVLDEADELLSGDYDADLQPVLFPEVGRTWRLILVSATRTPTLMSVAESVLVEPTRVELDDIEARLPNVDLHGMVTTGPSRDRLIGSILRLNHPRSAMVFCNRREDATRFAAKLSRYGFATVALTGSLAQNWRFAAVERFVSGKARVCVATDVAARGLNVEGLDLVIHAGVPENAQMLLHRSGRAGRHLNRGRAVLVLNSGERPMAERLARQLGRKIEWVSQPRTMEILISDRERITRDPVFLGGHSEEDRTLARLISDRFSQDAISKACAYLWRRAQPMAQEYTRADAETLKDHPRVWLAIDIGQRTRSDMSEIVRLICRTAEVEKSEIGRIHVGERLARFEIPEVLRDRVLATSQGKEPPITPFL